MFFDYENENLSEIFKRENEEYYLDPIRRKLILITPEETVRQKWINFILNSLNVPEHLISVEEKLSHYGIASKLRADIIINGNDNKGSKYPLCIVECKAPEVPISDKAFDQVFQYCDHIGAEFAIVSNGYSTYVYKYNENNDDYIRLDSIPTFKEMLNGEFIEYDWGVFPE